MVKSFVDEAPCVSLRVRLCLLRHNPPPDLFSVSSHLLMIKAVADGTTSMKSLLEKDAFKKRKEKEWLFSVEGNAI